MTKKQVIRAIKTLTKVFNTPAPVTVKDAAAAKIKDLIALL
jgi:hypothetical protein